MKKTKVVAAMIEKSDKIFIVQRACGNLAGKWEFPGGIVEPGETESKAIVRQILEQFNISVKCDEFICSTKYTNEMQEVVVKLYHCTYLSGEVVLKNHSSHILVDKSLLLSYDLIPSDIILAKKIIKKY